MLRGEANTRGAGASGSPEAESALEHGRLCLLVALLFFCKDVEGSKVELGDFWEAAANTVDIAIASSSSPHWEMKRAAALRAIGMAKSLSLPRSIIKGGKDNELEAEASEAIEALAGRGDAKGTKGVKGTPFAPETFSLLEEEFVEAMT